MDIDELASAIRATSTAPEVRHLSELLLQWKKDDTDVEYLQSSIEEKEIKGQVYIRSAVTGSTVEL